MSRYYLHCPECGTRMIRTGEEVEGAPDSREYKCPGCGSFFAYSEQSKAIVKTYLGFPRVKAVENSNANLTQTSIIMSSKS